MTWHSAQNDIFIIYTIFMCNSVEVIYHLYYKEVTHVTVCNSMLRRQWVTKYHEHFLLFLFQDQGLTEDVLVQLCIQRLHPEVV